MSKSNDSSKFGRTTPTPDLGGAVTFTARELRDDELQQVSGGFGTIFVESLKPCAGVDVSKAIELHY